MDLSKKGYNIEKALNEIKNDLSSPHSKNMKGNDLEIISRGLLKISEIVKNKKFISQILSFVSNLLSFIEINTQTVFYILPTFVVLLKREKQTKYKPKDNCQNQSLLSKRHLSQVIQSLDTIKNFLVNTVHSIDNEENRSFFDSLNLFYYALDLFL